MNTTGNRKSLGEINASVSTSHVKGWKKIFAFMGPAYMISVGYMDPGNWATDIAGGSLYGYKLLWVLVMSNLIAILLQSLSARLGIVTGKDLAQASRESYPRGVNFVLYLLAEVAIAACDLAEVIGMAIGIKLLFGLPLIWGVCITVLDTFLLLFLLNFGVRKMEAFIIALVALIGCCFFAELLFAHPVLGEVASGLIPSIPDAQALAIATGIIGATVMPHNLYLHSSLVQTRKIENTEPAKKKAIRFNVIDSVIALNLALFVNAAILILAASSFNKNGLQVTGIEEAHEFLTPLMGTGLAAILFAVALIAAGQSSTITGTLAGQIIMEGYLNLRLQPWVRRIITRLLAVVPAMLVIIFVGESATDDLLILSQIILSMQLGFAIVPLIHFVSNKEKMGSFAIRPFTQIISWLAAGIIVTLNIILVYDAVSGVIRESSQPVLMAFALLPLCFFFLVVLLYITLKPFVSKASGDTYTAHGKTQKLELKPDFVYSKIAIPVDFSAVDSKAISKALSLGGKDCEYLLIHVVESTNALLYGKESGDLESAEDRAKLEDYKLQISQVGYACSIQLGYGNPAKAIASIVNAKECSLVVMAGHGHKGIKDILFGTTLDKVRHGISVPLMIA
ncbi:MAG: mntH [Bacteroidetes bacterium]|jgi:manganese transport protein|nr:mntH [Bacteroidota bacterium]